MTAPDSLYHTITNDIIAELEQGVAPWVKPWTTEGGGAPLLPYNAASKRRYQGVNVLLLWKAAREKGYRSPAWLGYQQASGFGGHVKQGEKATLIAYGSTFVPNRLNRDLTGRFGEASYAAAELGAAFLCAALSIPGRLRHAEYLGSWLKLLQHDARAIFTAASKATEAARYLEEQGGRGVSTETDENEA